MLSSRVLLITTHARGRDNGLVARSGEELTILLADVVDGGRLRDGDPLTFGLLRTHLPAEWLPEWETSRARQIDDARRRRGLR